MEEGFDKVFADIQDTAAKLVNVTEPLRSALEGLIALREVVRQNEAKRGTDSRTEEQKHPAARKKRKITKKE